MALAHNLGFAGISGNRELKEAQEAFRRGELDEAGLSAVGRALRASQWQLQKDAGIELLPVGDFAWYDPVLSHSLTFGVIPQPLRGHKGSQAGLQALFAMAGDGVLGSDCDGADAPEMTRWFGTDAHYRVPEFSADQLFVLSGEQVFEEVDEAMALGHAVKPVVLGPLTYLWLGKTTGTAFDKLDLLDRLLPLYDQIFNRLASQGVEWVQIDEPILALDLPQAWKNAYERVYNILQRAPLKKLVATCFGGLGENLGLAANLPVDGLHVDLACAPDQYPTLVDRLPAYKVLSLGLVDGRDGKPCDLEQALALVRHAAERLGERLWLAPSCSLWLDAFEAEQEGAQAIAERKCMDVARLAQAANAWRASAGHGTASAAAAQNARAA